MGDQRNLLKSSGPCSPEACKRQLRMHDRMLIGGTQRVRRGGTLGAVVPGNLWVECMQRETCAFRLMLASSPHCPATPKPLTSSSLLYDLHALSFVLFARSALLCPKQTPTYAARARLESFLLHEDFTPLEVPEPTQCLSPPIWP